MHVRPRGCALLAAAAVFIAAPAIGAMTATPPSVSGFPTQTTAPIIVDLSFAATRAGGTGTIFDAGTPSGTTTVPAPITYSFGSGATTASTQFRFAIGAGTLPGTYNVDLRDTTNAAGLTTVTLVVNSPSLTPFASPNPVTLSIGGSSQPVTVNTSADPGFNARVTYAFTGLPAFINTGGPQTVSPPYAPLTFTFSLGAGAAGGTYSGTLTGSYNDAAGAPQSRSIPFTVLVQQPDIAASFSSPAISVCDGGPAVNDTIELSPLSGYSGTPQLSFSAPPGIVVSPATPSSGRMPPSQSIPFTVRSAGASTGPQVVTLTISDAAANVNKSITLVVDVSLPDFTPSVGPNVVNLTAGGGGLSVTASIVPNACFTAASITVEPSGQPPGITFNPPIATMSAPGYGAVSLVVQAAASVPPGTYSATVTFTPFGGAPRSVTLQINVAAQPDFRLDVNPASVSVAAGATTNVLVSATGINGFAGSVTVNAPNIPNLTFTPSTFTILTGGSQSVTIAASSTAAPATLSATFFGSAPGVGTRSAAVVITIAPGPDFLLDVSPTSIAIAQGQSGSVNVLATGLNGFSGPVTVTSAASGLTVSPSTFILTPGAPQSVTITVPTTAPTGPSTVTFSGSSPSVNGTRNATLTVDVSTRPDFAITVAPPSIAIQSGGSGSAVLSVVGLNGFSGQVTVVAAVPANVTVTPSSFSLTAGATQSVRIDVAPGTPAAGPVTIRFTATGAGTSHTADLLLTILPPRPIITAIVPPGVATGTRSLVLRLSGNFFMPGANITVGAPGVRVESVSILTAQLADVTLSVRADAAPGATQLVLTNPDGGSATTTLLIFPAGSIAAPLSVTTAAIVFPPQGTMIAPDEAIYPRGLLATTGLGTIIGVWKFDGVPFDRFTVTVGGGYPAEIRSHVPIPISFAGGHTLELAIESPQYAVSPALEVVMAAANVARLAIFAPRDGTVIVGDAPLFRWSLVPNTSGYLVEFDDFAARPKPRPQFRVSDPEWQPSPDTLRELGVGLHRWRVRAVFPGETEGEPTDWRRVAILPEHVELLVARPAVDPRTGRLVVRWSGGLSGLLYRVEVLAPSGNTIFAALTGGSEYALPASLRSLPPGSTVRVTALVPGGTTIGVSNSVVVAGNGSKSDHNFQLAQVAPTVTSQQPPNLATVTTSQPRIEARWSGSVRPDEVSLMLDQTDVTAVASIAAGSVSYDSLLPLTPGQHTVRLSLRDALTTWTFTVAEAAAAPSPEAMTKEDTPASAEKKQKTARGTIRPNWAITPVGTLTVIQGDGPNEKDDARLQLSTQTDLSNESVGAKASGNVSMKHALDDPNKTVQESRNWLTQFNAHQGPFKEELRIGFAAPGFVDQSELLTTGLARGGSEGRLHFPMAVASYYETFGTRPAGVVAGDFGPKQRIRAAALQSPTNPKWDIRLIGLRVTDEPGFNSAGGKGEAYGLFGKYVLNPQLTILGEIAHGSFEPNPGSAEGTREGTALRLGFSGVRGTLSYTINFRRTDSDFVNPANRGFTPGGVPDRTGANISLTKLIGRTSLGIQLRQLKDGNSSTAILPKNRENGGMVSLSTMFGSRVSLSLSGNWTGNNGQANPTLSLPKLDRRQSGASGTLSQSLGRFSLSQTVSYQQLSDAVNQLSNQKMTTASLTAAGALLKNLNVAAVLSGTRSEGSSLVGTTEHILASLQPSYTIPALSITLQPRAMYSRSKSDLTNQESKGEQYQGLLTWAPPWLRSGLSFQISADSNRNRTSNQVITPPFVRRYAGTFSLKWGAGNAPAAPTTTVINPPADAATTPSKDQSTTSSISQ